MEQFNSVVSKEPNLLEVFDVLNKGLTHSIDQDHKTLKHKVLANHLTHISSQIDMLLMDLQGHNISLKKMKTNENSNSPSMNESKKKNKINHKTKSSTDHLFPNCDRNHSTKPDFGFSPCFSDYKEPLPFNPEEEEFFLHDENMLEDNKNSNVMKKTLRKQKSKSAATMIIESPSHKTKMRNQFFAGEPPDQRKLKRSLTPNQLSQITDKKYGDDEKSEHEKHELTCEEDKYKENSIVIESFHSKTVTIIRRLKEIKESVKCAQFCLDDLYEKDAGVKKEENDEVQRNIIEEFRLKFFSSNFL